MKRRIITIDEEKCNGCGICVDACHEGAIALVEGKAKLIRDDYCDGLGDCLPACPVNAISFIEREAAPYDEQAVFKHQAKKKMMGCLGTSARLLSPKVHETSLLPQISALGQWPCQIQLAPLQAPYYQGAKLLIAADCSAYAYANMHQDFMRGKITLIGCPKLDPIDYSEKLTEIIRSNDVQGVQLVRMEVPCCKGLEEAVKRALINSGKFLPWHVVTITVDGKIKD